METNLIPFQGGFIEAVCDEKGKPWVVLRRLCDNLGIDAEGQRQRLSDGNRAPWASTCIMQATPSSDGKRYDMFCLDLETVPLWLATVDSSRVGEDARALLVLYQRECARALYERFFGRSAEQAATRRVLHRVGELERQMAELRAEVRRPQQLPLNWAPAAAPAAPPPAVEPALEALLRGWFELQREYGALRCSGVLRLAQGRPLGELLLRLFGVWPTVRRLAALLKRYRGKSIAGLRLDRRRVHVGHVWVLTEVGSTVSPADAITDPDAFAKELFTPEEADDEEDTDLPN